MHYFQHNIADYRKDTMHLTLLEHGCYRQLLDQYYLNEEPLPLDLTRLFRLINARTEDEQIAIKNIIEDFFIETENGFIHTRCDLEIEFFHARLESASKAGKASAEKRAKANERSTSVQPTNNLITNNLITNNSITHIRDIEDNFEIFWRAYPKKVGKETARKSWNKIRPNLQDVLNALAWQKDSKQWFEKGGQFIPNPSTYLNQHRWLDEQPLRVTF
jgi:uncharacterized protein YdaU (DUF1376 family)